MGGNEFTSVRNCDFDKENIVTLRLKCILLLIALATVCVTAQGQFTTPIEHVIIVIQENRTPDNMFQDPTLIASGADIGKATDAVPWTLGTCWDIGHGHVSWVKDYGLQSSGSFCPSTISVPTGCSKPTCPNDSFVKGPPQGDKTIKPYWDIAETYGFANYFFQTNQGPSFPAHQFLFGGTSGPVSYPSPAGTSGFPLYRDFAAENTPDFFDSGCVALTTQTVKDIDPTGTEGYYYQPTNPSPVPIGYPCYEHWTLSDQLESVGLTWRYYGRPSTQGEPVGAVIWDAPTAIQHICKGQPGGPCSGTDWQQHVDLTDSDILADISTKCDLSAVSWVIPDGLYSDHPGGNNHGGPDWVANIVKAVGTSGCTNPDTTTYWNSTAIFVVWDDWGGFYDHVVPYEVLKSTSQQHDDCKQFGCGYTAGFRVPLLVVSAYTGTLNNGNWSGYISGACQSGTCNNEQAPYIHDFGSILNFIQYVFSGEGMTQGDISLTAPNWQYDDFWAPDYYANNVLKCSPQTCPFGLSDFFGNPTTGYFKNKRPFQAITPQTYQAGDFVNLIGFGGESASEPPDEETP